MLRSIKRCAAAIAAFALVGLTSVAAEASTVIYYTTASFNVGSFDTAAGTAVIVPGPSAPLVAPHAGSTSVTVDQPTNGQSSTLTYTYSGTQLVTLINGKGTGLFGSFSVASGDLDPNWADAFDGLGFTLNIHQVYPDSGNATLIGSFTGELDSVTLPPVAGGGTMPSSTLVLKLNPFQVSIPATGGVTYTVMPPAGEVYIASTGLTTMSGTVAVPLPGVAVAGLWMLGGVGSLGLLKRRRAATVA